MINLFVFSRVLKSLFSQYERDCPALRCKVCVSRSVTSTVFDDLFLISDLISKVAILMPKSQTKAQLDQIIEKLDGQAARVDRLEKTVASIQQQIIEVDTKL